MLSRLTDDGRCGNPVFAAGDSMIYFERLLVADASDTTGRTPEELVRPYGIRISDKELYTLSQGYQIPERIGAPTGGLSERSGEKITLALQSPDGKAIAYETVIGNWRNSHTVYLSRGDSTFQLTYGDIPCFIERFSSTGRYLTVICGYEPSRIVLFDLEEDKAYMIHKDDNSLDYMTSFSSDDKMMIFIRSQKKYSIEYDFLGDIWLFRFSR